MGVRRIFAALLVAASLCAPAVAAAQTTVIPEDSANVSQQPPVQLSDGAAASGELPDTGTDPRVLFLAGIALMLLGAGLRLRTADADLY